MLLGHQDSLLNLLAKHVNLSVQVFVNFPEFSGLSFARIIPANVGYANNGLSSRDNWVNSLKSLLLKSLLWPALIPK
jgi:hypothetical protein